MCFIHNAASRATIFDDSRQHGTGTPKNTIVHVLRREHGAAGDGLPRSARPGVRGAGERRGIGAVGDRGRGLRGYSSRHRR